MDQMTLALDPPPKATRNEVSLDEKNAVLPSSALVELIQPDARDEHQGLDGMRPFLVETTVRVHCLQL